MHTTTYAGTLNLVTHLGARHPSPALPSRLDQLFAYLTSTALDAALVEDDIWALWMHYPHQRAAEVLDKAATDIAAHRFDIAETRLAMLLRACPNYAEAWNKRATLYYLLGRDEESVRDIHRVLELEPRHFGALAGLGEICLAAGDEAAARLAFQAALRLNPHLEAVRDEIDKLEAPARTGPA
ncbi:MAG: tetratricopeptide repeat protein [Betaproteobacteria bacterium]|nr:tetratricopeptide repeat protein [Betaproteobacteria bacterium]